MINFSLFTSLFDFSAFKSKSSDFLLYGFVFEFSFKNMFFS